MTIHKHFVIVIENWKFENWHFYHYVETGNKKYRWMEWKRIL